MSKFRFYITDNITEYIKGTDELEVALEFAVSEDCFVIDTANGTRYDIEEVLENE
jgi:hypothetical protein